LHGENAKPKLWTIPFVKIMSVNTLVSIASSMIITTLPLYVLSLGSTKSVAGLIMGVYTAASVFARPVFGNMVDGRGRKPVLVIGIGLFLCACTGYSFTSAVVAILIIRSLQGIGYSAHSTACGAVVADVLPQARLSEGIGYYGISYNIASSFGPALAIFMITTTGYHSIFYSTAAVSIIALALALTFDYEKKAKTAVIGTGHSGQNPPAILRRRKLTLDMVLERTAIPGALVMTLIMVPSGMIATFLATFGLSMGIRDVGLYFTVNAVALLLARLFIGKLCDRLGAQKVLVPGLALIFTGVLLIAFSRSLVAFLVAGAVLGFGYGMVNPTVQAFIMRTAPSHRRGAASATYFSALDIGSGVGSIAGGVLAQLFGFPFTFAVYSLFVAFAFLVFLLVLRRKISPQRVC
jgi:MFS family permease